MGHWGWRPLMLALYFSVWIAGCIATQQASPIETPTELPLITLVIRTPQQTPTQAPLGLPIITTLRPTVSPEGPAPTGYRETAFFGGLNLRPTATPLPLHLPEPICYETVDGGILCLGRVDNTQSHPVERVKMLVTLFQGNGEVLRSGEAVIEQHFLLAGDSAPYRVLFPAGDDHTLSDRFGGLTVTLLRAEDATQLVERAPGIQVTDERAEFTDGRYFAQAELLNVGPEEARIVRAVVTLYDDEGHMVGYRTVEIHDLPAGETAPIAVTVVPVVVDIPLHHTLHVEVEP